VSLDLGGHGFFPGWVSKEKGLWDLRDGSGEGGKEEKKEILNSREGESPHVPEKDEAKKRAVLARRENESRCGQGVDPLMSEGRDVHIKKRGFGCLGGKGRRRIRPELPWGLGG